MIPALYNREYKQKIHIIIIFQDKVMKKYQNLKITKINLNQKVLVILDCKTLLRIKQVHIQQE